MLYISVIITVMIDCNVITLMSEYSLFIKNLPLLLTLDDGQTDSNSTVPPVTDPGL